VEWEKDYFMKKVPFQSTHAILREYDMENDPEKLVIHLFNQMKSTEENINSVREGDKWFQDPDHQRKRFVAEIEGDLYATISVGQGMNRLEMHRYRMYSVVTAKQYQGTGLSALLFEYVKEWIEQQNGRLILVETWEDNMRARKFYEKLGFIQYGSLPNGLKNRNGKGFVPEIFYYFEINL
jgi:ribosomal protein S18 acetylase RimI-like enzyme